MYTKSPHDIAFGMTMAVLDGAIANVTLPTIASNFKPAQLNPFINPPSLQVILSIS